MTPFRRKAPTVRITFGEDGPLAGLVVVTRRPAPGHLVDVQAFASIQHEPGTPHVLTDEEASTILRVVDMVGELLVAWNYEDEEGNPLPPSAHTLRMEDVSFTLPFLTGWFEAFHPAATSEPAESPAVPGWTGEPDLSDLPVVINA